MTPPWSGQPVPPSGQPRLRPVEHPDMSPLLTHFCGRSRPQLLLPDGINAMTPSQRLANILWEGRLRAFQTYSGGDAAVCLTEATIDGLNFLVRRRGYAPWGLVFERQSVYDAGGGPVWYARTDEYKQLRQWISPRVQSRLVRLEAGRSDWLEEREWRIPVSDPAQPMPAVPLAALHLYAILVGEQHWTPGRLEYMIPPDSGRTEGVLIFPPTVLRVPRWCWDWQAGVFYQLPALV
jgi:hypothetical protein